MEDTFDYRDIPVNFGYCATMACDKADTCLRHLALRHASAEQAFLSILNPRRQEAMKGKCEFYLSAAPVRYAKGFMRTLNAMPAGSVRAFRYRVMAWMGRKNFYLSRQGNRLLSPDEQQYIVKAAKALGLELDEYFDGYVLAHKWH